MTLIDNLTLNSLSLFVEEESVLQCERITHYDVNIPKLAEESYVLLRRVSHPSGMRMNGAHDGGIQRKEGGVNHGTIITGESSGRKENLCDDIVLAPQESRKLARVDIPARFTYKFKRLMEDFHDG
jgi:hypothetical protein